MPKAKVRISDIEIEAEDTETTTADLIALVSSYVVDIFKNHYMPLVGDEIEEDEDVNPGVSKTDKVVSPDASVGGMMQ